MPLRMVCAASLLDAQHFLRTEQTTIGWKALQSFMGRMAASWIEVPCNDFILLLLLLLLFESSYVGQKMLNWLRFTSLLMCS